MDKRNFEIAIGVGILMLIAWNLFADAPKAPGSDFVPGGGDFGGHGATGNWWAAGTVNQIAGPSSVFDAPLV